MTGTSDLSALRQRALYVVTVNYHSSELTEELVRATLALGDSDLHLIIVDNSPNDPGLQRLAGCSSLTLVRADANLGFGAGCNLGLAYVHARDPGAIVWLLNPDARLLPGAISTVRQALQEAPRPALLGTRIRDLEGRIWFDRGRFDPCLGRLQHRPTSGPSRRSPTRSDWSDNKALTDPTVGPLLSEPSDWLSGCSLIFDLEVLNGVPRFDPQMFLDYEDAEVCLRLAQRGFPARVTRAVLVEHAVSAITTRVPSAKYRHATFSKLYLLHHHATAVALGLNLLYFSLRPLLLLPKDRAQALGRWAGLADYLRWLARQWRGDRQLRHPRTRFTAPS
jgi:N-acetylglucosaminyl-diphospho-decaprenol L-rhamnosyltransferase